MESNHDIHIPTVSFATYLVTKSLKELSNVTTRYAVFFYKDNCSKLADLFCDDKGLSVLCYLPDIFK